MRSTRRNSAIKTAALKSAAALEFDVTRITAAAAAASIVAVQVSGRALLSPYNRRRAIISPI